MNSFKSGIDIITFKDISGVSGTRGFAKKFIEELRQ
jgi:hypothetical protein